MQEVFQDRLWIGNARDARDFRLLFASGIAAVIDRAYEEPPAQLPRELIYCRFPITDSGDNLPETLQRVVESIA